jgi:hypothetical protein
MTKLVKEQTYNFSHLETFLNEWENRNKLLIVKDKANNATAVMHIFLENFCGDWKSGDGILFYSDGEAHSAESYDEFLLIDIVTF